MKFQSKVTLYRHDARCRNMHCCQDKQTAQSSTPFRLALMQPHLFSVIVCPPFPVFLSGLLQEIKIILLSLFTSLYMLLHH